MNIVSASRQIRLGVAPLRSSPVTRAWPTSNETIAGAERDDRLGGARDQRDDATWSARKRDDPAAVVDERGRRARGRLPAASGNQEQRQNKNTRHSHCSRNGGC
jgi:hypothetical protein